MFIGKHILPAMLAVFISQAGYTSMPSVSQPIQKLTVCSPACMALTIVERAVAAVPTPDETTVTVGGVTIGTCNQCTIHKKTAAALPTPAV